MAEIVAHITDARDNGTINVYGVRYNQRGRADNMAVALPGDPSFDFRHDFCENIIDFENAREVTFNPTSDGLEEGTYEYIPLDNVREKWDELTGLIEGALPYHGVENQRKVTQSNLYIGALDYNEKRYYLCAKQGESSERVFRGKSIYMSNQDRLQKVELGEVFIMNSFVGVMIDPSEEKVLIFDKKAFQGVFRYDDYQKEDVQRKISMVEQWNFLASVEIIKEKCAQKNVYRNLAKIFADQEYMEQIRSTTPQQLKNNLLMNSPENFMENDFQGDLLVVTTRNLDIVMKMLAKGFKFNFFTNSAEQQ